jgi:hypothetical protein
MIGVKPGTATTDLLLFESLSLKAGVETLETIGGAETALIEGLVVLAGFRDVARLTADCALALAACLRFCLVTIEVMFPCLQ